MCKADSFEIPVWIFHFHHIIQELFEHNCKIPTNELYDIMTGRGH